MTLQKLEDNCREICRLGRGTSIEGLTDNVLALASGIQMEKEPLNELLRALDEVYSEAELSGIHDEVQNSREIIQELLKEIKDSQVTQIISIKVTGDRENLNELIQEAVEYVLQGHSSNSNENNLGDWYFSVSE